MKTYEVHISRQQNYNFDAPLLLEDKRCTSSTFASQLPIADQYLRYCRATLKPVRSQHDPILCLVSSWAMVLRDEDDPIKHLNNISINTLEAGTINIIQNKAGYGKRNENED